MLKIYFNYVSYRQVLFRLLAAPNQYMFKSIQFWQCAGGFLWNSKFWWWLKMSSYWTGKATSGALVESNSVEIITVITCFHVPNSWMISLPSLTFCQVVFLVFSLQNTQTFAFSSTIKYTSEVRMWNHHFSEGWAHVWSQLCVRFVRMFKQERHL